LRALKEVQAARQQDRLIGLATGGIMNIQNQYSRRVSMALLGAPLVTWLAGCGGGSDDSGSSGGGTRTTPSTTASTDSLKQPMAAKPASGNTLGLRHMPRPDSRRGITAIVRSADGNTVGVANTDGRVLVLNAQGQELRTLAPRGSPMSAGLVFSADGRLLVSVSRDSLAQGWAVDTGVLEFTLRGHQHGLRAVASSTNGALIATGGEDTRVLAWDGTNGFLRGTFSSLSNFVNALGISPDAQLLAGGDADGQVLLWETGSSRLRFKLRGHADEINAVGFSPDGSRLASAGSDRKVLIWDVVSGSPLRALVGQGSSVRSLSFNSDGTLLAGGCEDGRVLVWDHSTGSVVQDLGGGNAAINSLAFDRRPRNDLLAGTTAATAPALAGSYTIDF
jgi:WD40 repeat protein